MNPIQRAWLYVLKPVAYVVNDKLAKRSGLLGKFGRFFAVGPREFGFHPSNRILIAGNRYLLNIFAWSFHRYSVMK